MCPRFIILGSAYIITDSIGAVSLDFIRKHAEAVMHASLISYVKDAQLRRSLFNTRETYRVVSLVYAKFFVNYTKLLKALA